MKYVQTVTLSGIISLSHPFSPLYSSECEDACWQSVLTFVLPITPALIAPQKLCIFLYYIFMPTTDCVHPRVSILVCSRVGGSVCVSPFFCKIFFCCQLTADDDRDERLAADIHSEYMIIECMKRLVSLGKCK